jgi:hypothetical protein
MRQRQMILMKPESLIPITVICKGWKKIMFGKFAWGEHWYINPWLLSGCALFLISGLLLLIWTTPRAGSHLKL